MISSLFGPWREQWSWDKHSAVGRARSRVEQEGLPGIFSYLCGQRSSRARSIYGEAYSLPTTRDHFGDLP